MKAVEYANKYKDGVSSSDNKVFVEAVNGLFKDMLDEITNLIKTRNVKFDRGVIPIVKEQNDKWNATCRCWAKELGESPIKEDGLLFLLEQKMPGITNQVKNSKQGRAAARPRW